MSLLKYIELKSGYSDDGPAWVARVQTSRSRQTIYFNGLALKRSKGVAGNHIDLESSDECWVSGIKKDGTDRHWAGGGIVSIEKSAVAEYLELVGRAELDRSRFVVVEDLPAPSPGRHHELENESV